MKTKLTSFFTTILLFLSLTASMTFASESFYDKNLVRGFISIGGEYKHMSADHMKYVNQLLFEGSGGTIVGMQDTLAILNYDSEISNYRYFKSSVLGLNINIGAEYKQLMSWFNINFMPTQVSKRPSKYGDFGNQLSDASWFTYGADWMFGWKIFPEQSVVNLIPSIGLGFSLLNIHLASEYTYIKQGSKVTASEEGFLVKNEDLITMKDRYYSNFSSSVHAELELRFNFDPIAIGVYGGYRYVRYGTLDIQADEKDENTKWILGEPDVNGDALFIGARVTWTFLSKRQKELKIKL